MDRVPKECFRFNECAGVGLSCVHGRCAVPGLHMRCSATEGLILFSVDCEPGLICLTDCGRCVTQSEYDAKTLRGTVGSIIDCKPDEYFSSNSRCEPRHELGQACEKDSCEEGLACSEVEGICVRKCFKGVRNIRFVCGLEETCVKLDSKRYDPNNNETYLGYCAPLSKLPKVNEDSTSTTTTNDTNNTNNTTNSNNKSEPDPMVIIVVMAFVFFIILAIFLFSKKKSRTVVYSNPTVVPTYVAGPGGGPTYVAGPGGSTVIYTNQPPPYSPR